jgi:hypothetical protein
MTRKPVEMKVRWHGTQEATHRTTFSVAYIVKERRLDVRVRAAAERGQSDFSLE